MSRKRNCKVFLFHPIGASALNINFNFYYSSFAKCEVTETLKVPNVNTFQVFISSRQNERERTNRKEDLDLCFGANGKKINCIMSLEGNNRFMFRIYEHYFSSLLRIISSSVGAC